MIKQDIKVLICDDTASIGVMLASELRERGFFVYTRSRTENSVILSMIRKIPPAKERGNTEMFPKTVSVTGCVYFTRQERHYETRHFITVTA